MYQQGLFYYHLYPPIGISNRQAQKINRAYAEIKGGPLAPNIYGFVVFTDMGNGTDVFIELTGLPPYQKRGNNQNPIGPHAFHIHEKGNCTIGNSADPFQKAGGHWNPSNQSHGNHAGDLPVIFSNNGYTRMNVFTDKFRVQEVIGKTVIIHESPDDYRTQPAGDAGKRLACGVIRPLY